MPRCIPSWIPFFNRFLVDFYSQLRPPESQKSSPRCSESTIFQKIALRKWHRFLIDFGANLAPFCLPKSSKILPKIDPKMHQIFDRFLHRFFVHFSSNLGPKLGPCWPLFRLKRGGPVRCLASFLLRCFLESIFFAREGGTPSHGAMGYPALALILGSFGVCVGVFWPHLGSSLEVVCLHVGTTPSPMGYPLCDSRPGGSRDVGDSYYDSFGNLIPLLFCIVFRCLFKSILTLLFSIDFSRFFYPKDR